MQDLTLQLFATLLGASAWAVREDLLSRRIPNRLTGSLLCLGLTLQFTSGGWTALGEAVLGVLVGLAILLPLYMLRATGAGDVKLLAAAGALLGPYWAALGGVYTLMAGGILAAAYVLWGAGAAAFAQASQPWPLRIQLARERAQQLRRERFPYALAIAVGVIGAAAQRGDLKLACDYLSGGGS
jgi:prepilin peptidase CpaA